MLHFSYVNLSKYIFIFICKLGTLVGIARSYQRKHEMEIRTAYPFPWNLGVTIAGQQGDNETNHVVLLDSALVVLCSVIITVWSEH